MHRREEEKILQGEWDLSLTGGQRLIGSTPNDANVADSLTTHKAEEDRRRCLEAMKTDLQDIPDERLAKFKDGLRLIVLKHEVGRQRNKT